MLDLAPNWQVRCPKCGNTRPHGEIAIRLFAASRRKRTLAFCRNCHCLRFAIVERSTSSKHSLQELYEGL